MQDAVLLLRPEEAILSPGPRRTWRLAFSSDSARVGTRQLYIPNLFAVHRPIFKGSWRAEATFDSASEDWSKLGRRYQVVAPLVMSIAVLLFLVLPAAFLLDLALPWKLALLGLLYADIAVTLGWLHQHRERHALSARKMYSLMVECLVCPPVAANLVRRLSLAVTVRQDLLNAAQQLLDDADWAQARVAFAERVETVVDAEAPGTPRHDGATRLLVRLTGAPQAQ